MALILQSRRRRPARRALRRWAWLVATALAAAAVWQGWDPALVRYRQWKQQRALRQAREFIARRDAADAQLALRVAFTAVPDSIEAWRVAADMLEEAGSRRSLELRQHIVQMMSSTPDDKVALVNCALKFGDVNAARDALSTMTSAEASKPSALAAALSFALFTENAPVADALFDRLKALTPNSQDLKVGQALLRLRHPNPEKAAAARRELEDLAVQPKYALRIHRELMSDALRRRDLAAASRWAARAEADPGSDFTDRLHRANFDLLFAHRPFEAVFSRLAPAAAADPGAAAELGRWMLVQGKGAEADRWLGGLAPAVRESAPVAAVQAEAAAQRKDWDRLATLIQAGAWGPVPGDTVRLAMAARLMSARGNPALQQLIWDEAVQSTENNLFGLSVLRRLAGIWRWESESESTLWAIARTFPEQTWVHQALFNAYRSRNDTTNMREVLNLLCEANPSVPRYRHDWALLSLLTEPSADWNRPKEILQELYQEDQTNPYYVTSYAFALAQAGKGQKALAVIAKLSHAEHDYSPRAPYLAYIYGLNGRIDEVERLQNLAQRTAYLPEEQMLFTEAREAPLRRTASPKAPPKSGAKASPAS